MRYFLSSLLIFSSMAFAQDSQVTRPYQPASNFKKIECSTRYVFSKNGSYNDYGQGQTQIVKKHTFTLQPALDLVNYTQKITIIPGKQVVSILVGITNKQITQMSLNLLVSPFTKQGAQSPVVSSHPGTYNSEKPELSKGVLTNSATLMMPHDFYELICKLVK